MDAELLIILTDIDGLYNGDPGKGSGVTLVKTVEEITPEVLNYAGEKEVFSQQEE